MTVASNIELKTASASKLEDLKDNFLKNSRNCDEIFGHRIFDVTALLSVFAVLCCPVCLHDELSLTEDSRYVMCSNFSLKCRNCDFLKGFTSSEKINNKFKLNTLIAFALRITGKGYTAGNKLFGMLDLPFLSKTAFRNQELKIQQAASIVSIESKKNAATEVKKLKNSPLESISCCGVSMDGTWQKRSYSSHNGCVNCISIDTRKIFDIEIMSHFCRICSKKTKVSDAAFNAYVCCNHMGSASSMETVGAYRIFERSENHRKLQYSDKYGDGDSKAYESVKNMYAPHAVNKLECIGPVQKRVGSHLRKLKISLIGLGGKGKLTDNFIDKLQNYYGIAIRNGDRFNSYQVIYSQFGLAIHQNDHPARRRFVEWAQNEIAVVPDFHKRILFSDEAHFWLNGYVSKQNCRIWSEANPQVYVETPLHPEKLTVWCALWAGGILLQKR
ncbi:uncharacterized protein TNCV_3924541 [Trichonephila clavipes]|nr:uncharacterized protein TNCV_3924541 [Trichonephila clavipes]